MPVDFTGLTFTEAPFALKDEGGDDAWTQRVLGIAASLVIATAIPLPWADDAASDFVQFIPEDTAVGYSLEIPVATAIPVPWAGGFDDETWISPLAPWDEEVWQIPIPSPPPWTQRVFTDDDVIGITPPTIFGLEEMDFPIVLTLPFVRVPQAMVDDDDWPTPPAPVTLPFDEAVWSNLYGGMVWPLLSPLMLVQAVAEDDLIPEAAGTSILVGDLVPGPSHEWPTTTSVGGGAGWTSTTVGGGAGWTKT